MPRDYRLYLDDILESIEKILKYTKAMDYDTFLNDNKTIDAVLRNLEVIGEASKNLPDNIISVSSEIEWKKIRGLRDILAHQYFGINATIIWDIVENKLISLQKVCEKLLKK